MSAIAERSVAKSPLLYEVDFYAWTIQQVAALKNLDVIEGLDKENLIEEIESMGRRELRGLISALEQTLIHLLKLAYSPAADPRNGWTESVRKQRHDMQFLLEDSPSLRSKLPENFERAWAYARKETIAQLKDHGETPNIPSECPFTIELTLDDEFVPPQQSADAKPTKGWSR
jgi:hypothetical protein